MTAAVIAIWLLTAAVTKYNLTEAALLMPVVVLVLGATAAVVIFWARVARGPARTDRAGDASPPAGDRRQRPASRARGSRADRRESR